MSLFPTWDNIARWPVVRGPAVRRLAVRGVNIDRAGAGSAGVLLLELCQGANQIRSAQSLDWRESTAASVRCSSFVFSVQLHLTSAPAPPSTPLLPVSDCLFAFSKIWGVSYSLTKVLPNPFWSRDKPWATPCFSFNDDMLSSTDLTAASMLRAPLFKSLQQYPVPLQLSNLHPLSSHGTLNGPVSFWSALDSDESFPNVSLRFHTWNLSNPAAFQGQPNSLLQKWVYILQFYVLLIPVNLKFQEPLTLKFKKQNLYLVSKVNWSSLIFEHHWYFTREQEYPW